MATSITSTYRPAHSHKPLASQRSASGDISITFFVQPGCPSRFASSDQHRIKGLNAETITRWFLMASYIYLFSVDSSLLTYIIPAFISLFITNQFPLLSPIISFTSPIISPGPALLRKESMPALDDLTTFLALRNPNKTPYRGFHPFQIFIIFPIRTNP
ncbi:hypothetical protein EDB81DRAFT_842357 [Dactylonectria macrodidyma]|uniref:Uncharacterized protein n=1 Tax=Dactylonectria macrodidyma TaxID=307937 RepID=A0A9P9J3U6_9HYPO|nr:hypothetical protein EDB81DRAFT_842357 [Dactylonectria macrodidyma]